MFISKHRCRLIVLAIVFTAFLGSVAEKLLAVDRPPFQVELPQMVQPFPEPLPTDHPAPGFKFRGTKGWAWTPEQYLAEIPFLARFKMNFLMNCYTSMFTSPTNHVGDWINEWWKPLPDWKKKAYARVIRSCKTNGITFCFAIHPQLGSPRPFSFDRPGDVEDLYQNYSWAQSQGVHWFSVSLDDVSWTNGGPAIAGIKDAQLVNTIIGRLRQKDPGAQMIFCPGPYSGDGSAPGDHAYLTAMGKTLDQQVYVFWTGDGVVASQITVRAAESYKNVAQHRLFIWDNYPVNDNANTLHLGPVTGRPSALCDVADGYMSNPMARENEINRLPLATCADYAYNPWNYDPDRSIGQAILALARTPAQRQLLKELVETYPGFLRTGGITSSNPVREKFNQLLASPNSRQPAQDWMRHIANLSTQIKIEFPKEFAEAAKTVANDADWMKTKL
jgi:hypothetical protein